MVLLAALLSAHAADDACFDCCRAGGLATCEAELRVYGEGSHIARDGEAWRVVGLWEIGCGGKGAFDAGASVVLDHPPQVGELVMRPVNPLQVHCFLQACALPETACVSPVDDLGRYFLRDCGSGLPVDGATLSDVVPTTRLPGATIVVVDGRPLVVQPGTGTTFAPGTTNGSVASASSRIAPRGAAVVPGPIAPPVVPAPIAPTVIEPRPVAPPSSDPMAALAATLPADPPATCKTPPDAVRAEARKRVDAGDDRRLRKDALGALQEYRAALTMDVCNAYAWNGIGDVASDAARPDLAVRALRNTTRLLPGHYGAWTTLGRNYEALRQSALAAEAYAAALALRPGLPEALDGWRRTAAP